MPDIAIRWTVGDVSARGFEALRLSILGAWRIFGDEADYAVCVNAIAVEAARERTAAGPAPVQWHRADRDSMPAFLKRRLDDGFAEGVAWKLAPLRLFPERWEISLDNDCLLWAMPEGMRAWLASGAADTCLLAEDLVPAFGRYGALCGDEPRNSGIRGLPPGFDLGGALAEIIDAAPGPLVSELDEQGLQVAALSRAAPARVVTIDEVALCSPTHQQTLGRCGAHFVGLNVTSERPYFGRDALDRIAANWDRWKPHIAEAVGASGR